VSEPNTNNGGTGSRPSALKDEADPSRGSESGHVLLVQNSRTGGNGGYGGCQPSDTSQRNHRIAGSDHDAAKSIGPAEKVAEKGVSWMRSVENAGQANPSATVSRLPTSKTANAKCRAVAQQQGGENGELSDDEILSQFSDRTESITSFESSDATFADSMARGTLTNDASTSEAQHSFIEKENEGGSVDRPRKRRVTDSASSHKARASRGPKTSKATKRELKAGSKEAATKDGRKQTTLSMWIKQKKQS
jgi:hypothetical protein